MKKLYRKQDIIKFDVSIKDLNHFHYYFDFDFDFVSKLKILKIFKTYFVIIQLKIIKFAMDYSLVEQIQQRPVVNLLKQGEDIVISGVGGKFPLSNCTDEFAYNLFNHIDMITEDQNEERWPKCKSDYLFNSI